MGGATRYESLESDTADANAGHYVQEWRQARREAAKQNDPAVIARREAALKRLHEIRERTKEHNCRHGAKRKARRRIV